MAITRSDIAAQLEYNVRTGFLKSQTAYQPKRAPFVSEAPSTGAFESYADMGSTPWPKQNGGILGGSTVDTRTQSQVAGSVGEGEQVTVVGGGEASMIIYNVDWEITIGIYHTAIDDNRVGSLERWANGAGRRFEQHRDYLAFDALRNGGSDKYGLGYDGVSLFNASHIDKDGTYVTGQSNTGAVALANAAYETRKVAGSKFLDSHGQPVGASHDLLIVPPDLEVTGSQITMNRELAGTSNRDMNPYAGNVRMLVAPGAWLTSTAWYIVDENMEAPLIIQNRTNPSLVIWDDNFQGHGVRYYKWISRYNIAPGNWRAILRGNS